MLALTPSERRGALVVVLVLLIGAGFDFVRLTRSRPAPPAPVPERAAVLDTLGAQPIAPRLAHLLDLNRATAAELDRLPGIGPVLAARIVAHREAHGPFRDPAELIAVPGIGPALAARLAPLVTTSASAPR